jgi:PGF-pre-PGF domain-containing protein
MSNDIPPGINQSTGLIPFRKFIDLSTSLNIEFSLNWMNIKIYYTEDELKTSCLDENSLRISHYNESSGMWETIDKGGVNTANTNNFSGYFWANVSHLSTFALVGSYPPPAQNVQSSPSSGGGGGGGEGASAENYSNIELNEKYDLHIFKDKTTRYRFTSDRNPIMFVNITGNVNAGEVRTAIEVLRNTSSQVRNPASEVVYKNLNIWVGTSGFASSKNIQQTAIFFRVENSWLDENNIAGGNIKIVRWDGSRWVDIVTSEKTNDGKYTYFEAKTDGFSFFTITGVKEVSTAAFQNIYTVQPAGITDTTGIDSPGTAPPINLNMIIGFLSFFGLIGIIYLKGKIMNGSK